MLVWWQHVKQTHQGERELYLREKKKRISAKRQNIEGLWKTYVRAKSARPDMALNLARYLNGKTMKAARMAVGYLLQTPMKESSSQDQGSGGGRSVLQQTLKEEFTDCVPGHVLGRTTWSSKLQKTSTRLTSLD